MQMLVDDIGDVTVTNDGATILKLLEVQHPAAKVAVLRPRGAGREPGQDSNSVGAAAPPDQQRRSSGGGASSRVPRCCCRHSTSAPAHAQAVQQRGVKAACRCTQSRRSSRLSAARPRQHQQQHDCTAPSAVPSPPAAAAVLSLNHHPAICPPTFLPACLPPQILVELAELQDAEVGDGTTSVVILAAELLKRANDLVRAKIHPTSIIAGYRLAMREVRAFGRGRAGGRAGGRRAGGGAGRQHAGHLSGWREFRQQRRRRWRRTLWQQAAAAAALRRRRRQLLSACCASLCARECPQPQSVTCTHVLACPARCLSVHCCFAAAAASLLLLYCCCLPPALAGGQVC